MDIQEFDNSLENLLEKGYVIKIGDGYMITEVGIRAVQQLQEDMAQPKN